MFEHGFSAQLIKIIFINMMKMMKVKMPAKTKRTQKKQTKKLPILHHLLVFKNIRVVIQPLILTLVKKVELRFQI